MSSGGIFPSGRVRLAAREGEAARGPALVIEFAGLPGAGKSSVAAVTMAELRRLGHRCADRSEIARPRGSRPAHFGRLTRFYLGHLPLLAAVGRIARTSRARRLTALTHALKLHAWSYRLRRANAMSADLVILDQGPVQQAWSMMLHYGFADDVALSDAVAQILAEAGMRHAYVWFEVDPRLAAERIWQRETMESTFDQLDRDASLRMLEAQGASLRGLFDRVAAATGAATHVIDGTRSIEEIGCALVDFVERVSAEWHRP